MQPNAFAARAYAQTTRSIGAPRNIEYQAFQRVTAMLRTAKERDALDAEGVKAVFMNNKLWATLASDLLSSGNRLPQSLRAQLLGLAEFSRKHGLRAMAGQADIQELIEINQIIMRALRADGVADTAAPSATAAPAASAAATL